MPSLLRQKEGLTCGSNYEANTITSNDNMEVIGHIQLNKCSGVRY